jgi:hypothetical protein
MKQMNCSGCGSLVVMQVVQVGPNAPQSFQAGDPDWMLYCPVCAAARSPARSRRYRTATPRRP